MVIIRKNKYQEESKELEEEERVLTNNSTKMSTAKSTSNGASSSSSRGRNDPLFASFYVTASPSSRRQSAYPLEKNRHASQSSSPSTAPLTRQALGYMLLLALQFGVQPTLTRRYISSTCDTGACRSTVVLVQELFKFVIASACLFFTGQWSDATEGWSVYTWAAVAGVPSALYCVQNLSALLAYQNLDALTFNVLNQTKTLSAALCCYLVMGRRQSVVQLLSLVMLLVAALIMEGVLTPAVFSGNSTSELNLSARHVTHGVAPVLLASFLSGLAGALSQKNLQSSSGCGTSGGRNSYLFSMELCSASFLILITGLYLSGDGAVIWQNGFFDRWDVYTAIPIVTNSLGGIVVGLVTKHAGSVRKGFALVFGIFLSGLIQAWTEEGTGGGVSARQVVGGTLAAVSLLMHCTHPYVPPPTKSTEESSSKSKSSKANGANGSTTNGAPPVRARRKARKED